MDTSFQAVCEAAAAEWAVPALAIGIAAGDRDETLFLGCDAGTRFRIASVTKPMTAALALQLLDAAEPARVWPEDVSVGHLLSHTSGFDCELADGDQHGFGDGDDALARCVAELPAVRRLVGSDVVWSYANTGYWLAGHLAAERAGTSYEEALAARVVGAAGLDATSFAEPDLAGTGADALPGPYPRARRPSGGLTSTVADLLRFGRWHLALPLGAAMRTVRGKPVGGVYGLGLFGERVGGVDVWGHSGSYGGFQSSFLTVPDRDAVFVGLTNASKGAKALWQIENAFFDDVVGARRRVPERLVPAPGALEPFAGAYANSDDRYEVEVAGDALLLRRDDGDHLGAMIAPRTFQIASGARVNERFDFPLDGFGRFGARLAERVA